MAENIYVQPTRVITSGSVHTAPCFLARVLIGTDNINNPTVVIYNEADNSKTESKRVLPSVSYDASALGLNGVVFEFMEFLDEGLYVDITCGGTCEVIVSSRLASSVSQYAFR